MQTTILVVEDLGYSRVMLDRELSERGYKVIMAEDGLKALEIMKSMETHLVLLDLNMPILNGDKFIQIVRTQLKSNVPIIVTSGGIDKKIISQLRPYKISGFMSKPIEMESLLEMIEEAVAQPGEENAVEKPFDINSAETDESVPAAKTVLVADDHGYIRKQVENILTGRGYNVIPTRDGLQALEELSKNKVDLLITDYEMPRMDGISLIRQIRENKMDIPVLLTSTHPKAKLKQFLSLLEISEFIQKPIDEDALVKSCALLLEGADQEDRSSSSALNILVITSNNRLIKNLQYILEDSGLNIIKSDNLSDGNRKAKHPSIESVFIDLDISGIDGLDALRSLNKERVTSEKQVYILTEKELEAAVQAEIQHLGAGKIFQLPLKISELVDEMKHLGKGTDQGAEPSDPGE